MQVSKINGDLQPKKCPLIHDLVCRYPLTTVFNYRLIYCLFKRTLLKRLQQQETEVDVLQIDTLGSWRFYYKGPTRTKFAIRGTDIKCRHFISGMKMQVHCALHLSTSLFSTHQIFFIEVERYLLSLL